MSPAALRALAMLEAAGSMAAWRWAEAVPESVRGELRAAGCVRTVPSTEGGYLLIEPVETEWSHAPEAPPLPAVNLEGLGVQMTAPSKRRGETRRLYAAPLTEAMLARCRAGAKGACA